MPRIMNRRSEDENIGVSAATLLDGELFWDKSTKDLYISDGPDNPRKIQKLITVSSSPPSASTIGLQGDIYIQYLT